MPDGKLTFDTKINSDGFEQGKKEIEKKAEELDNELNQPAEKKVEIDADTSQAKQAVDDLSADIHQVADEPVEIPINTEPTTDATEEIKEDLEDVQDNANKTSKSISSHVGTAAKTAENKVDSAANHIEESLRKVQNGFKSLLAAAGIGVSIGAVTKFGKEAVEAAASINAANSQLSQTFGVLEGNATAAMERVADASGILKTRLQGVGTSVYAFARTSGMDTAQALGMMEESLQVAADSAAYYDRSLEDTSETLMSFLKGNYANDAALGLSATETTRNAAAMKLYGKSFQELSEAQKQLTLLQMVKDANALSGAEGQAAREAEGWENVIGNLKEAWRQLLAVVGQPVLKLAISWVQQLTQALTTLTEKAQIAMNTLAALFGKEVEDTGQAAENITQSVSAQEDLTDAVEDTAKAESKSLAGFDKINTVASKNADTSGGKGSSSGGASALTPSIKVSDNTKATSKRLEKFIKTAQKYFNTFSGYLSKNFSPSFKKVWTKLSPQIKRFGENWRQVFSDIRTDIVPELKTYLNNDFVPFMQTFIETTGVILAGLLDSCNTVFSDIWNVAAKPMLEAFITDGLPMITEFCEEATLTYGTLFDEVKGGFDTIWKDAAVPALEGISTAWQDTMKILSEFWDKHGKAVFSKFRTAIKTTGDTLSNVWKSIFKPVFDKLMSVMDELWDNHAKPLLKNFLDFAGTLAEVALDIYNKFIMPLVNWFVDVFGPSIAGVLQQLLKNFGNKIGGIMDILNSFFILLKDVLNFLTNVFKGNWSDAWKDIKKIFKDVWDSFISIAKYPLNRIIDLINLFLSRVEAALQACVNALNKISIDIPDWSPIGSGSTLGFDLPDVEIKPIPQLAQGTVVPANFGNFLAMLGDNKREPEVISPQSTIEKAVENALARMGGGGDQTIHVHVDLDGREIGKVAVKAVRDDNARKGVA